MINHRLAPAQRLLDTCGPSPSIVVAIRITLNQPAGGPVRVEVDESAPLDDAMWRPEGVDTGHAHHSPAETGEDVDGRASTPVPPIGAAARRTPYRGLHHVDAEVELSANSADVMGRRRQASTAPPAGSPIHTRRPSTNDTVRRQTSGSAGRAPSRRVRRHALIATAVAIAAILAGVATMPSTPRQASTAAPPATVALSETTNASAAPPRVSAAATLPVAPVRAILLDGEDSPTFTQDDCTGTTSKRVAGGTTGCARKQDHSLSNPTSGITVSPCPHLLVAAALTLGADPTTWIVTLIDSGGHPGQTIDQAVRQRLVTARTALRRANQSDPEAINMRIELDSVIAEAGREPCWSTTCTSDVEPDSVPTRRRRTGTGRAGWQWLCAS
jgi:hypothetical protein